MYAGIDVGGTKTLVAALDDNGVITEQVKFPTPPDYLEFLRELKTTLATLKTKDFQAGAIGIPATVLSREDGVGVSFGNLPWRNVHVQADVEELLHCPTVVENDAKLAGLSEAMLVKDTYKKVLYVTVSTGIGIALIVNQTIDTSFGDGGGKGILLEHNGKLTSWESFASGKAIYEHYGKPAREITDGRAWHTIAQRIAQGLIELIALTEPELIIIGGSIGTYFENYRQPLIAALKQYEVPLISIPDIIGAQRAETAVIYGCYDLARASFSPATPKSKRAKN
jgi:predicted NBD/HSP70 family sugar kinase